MENKWWFVILVLVVSVFGYYSMFVVAEPLFGAPTTQITSCGFVPESVPSVFLGSCADWAREQYKVCKACCFEAAGDPILLGDGWGYPPMVQSALLTCLGGGLEFDSSEHTGLSGGYGCIGDLQAALNACPPEISAQPTTRRPATQPGDLVGPPSP